MSLLNYFKKKPSFLVNQQPVKKCIRSPTDFTEAFTLTFSEKVENHAGMEQIGEVVKSGFTRKELEMAKQWFEEKEIKVELIDLKEYLPDDLDYDGDDAIVLIARKGLNAILEDEFTADDLFDEQAKLDKDRKAFMYGRVVNKKLRHNLCFADFDQEADFENKKGTVIDFKHLPVLSKVREMIPKTIGKNGKNLLAEGNYYYDIEKCGIGYHGDAERRRIWAVKLGAKIPLHFHWFLRGEPVGKTAKLSFSHGDIYIMGNKAVGTDWKKKVILTLRHAAGCPKCLVLP